ncbi:MAG: hypothetical protein AAGF74_00075 [Pseudomonadota bacterium]
MNADLPYFALSVRQPWAWAIIHGGKDIENRTPGAVRAGRMVPGRICIHAATGMTEREYRWAVWKMGETGVRVPLPSALVRRAIIGTVDVVDITEASESPWFGGPCGLVLQDPRPVAPIACAGALGYFEWSADGHVSPAAPWMERFGKPKDGDGTLPLFDALDVSFAAPPEKPFGRKK